MTTWSSAPKYKEERMAPVENYVTVSEAAQELGVSPATIRGAIMRRHITPVQLHKRTNLIPRSEIERYRRERLGRRGKRMLPDEVLTEKQRKQRAYQKAYYQRRKAARTQQPATEPEE
jgi:excisionase family DNA binding protein